MEQFRANMFWVAVAGIAGLMVLIGARAKLPKLVFRALRMAIITVGCGLVLLTMTGAQQEWFAIGSGFALLILALLVKLPQSQ